MMKLPQDIILKPIITEKSMIGVRDRKYSFKVDRNANKIQISQAVEKLFDVKVEKVNVVNVRGRQKRVGRYQGYTPNWKKAVVTLKGDSKPIEFFEGML